MRTLMRRIRRLEALQAAKSTPAAQWFIMWLPEDYVGERHLVVRERSPHYIEAEELPGPGPQDDEAIYEDFCFNGQNSRVRVCG
jgi:hypothetical protein